MKAYHVRNNTIQLIEQDVPDIQSGQVLVKMEAVSLNYRDILVTSGTGRWKPVEDRIPVSDGAGTVAGLGANVKDLRERDFVTSLIAPFWQRGALSLEKLQGALGGAFADGVLAEYVVLDESAVSKAPHYLSPEEASTLPCAALTAWNAIVEKSTLKPGDSVLILGTGGVSLFAAQFALMSGCEVIVTSSSDDKLDMVKKLGAHHTVNYQSGSDWEEEVLELTDGRGVDQVVDIVGGDHVNRSLKCVRFEGTVSLVGVLAGTSGVIDTDAIMTKSVRLQGVEVGSKEMYGRMLRAMESHRLRPVISKVFEFERALEAFDYLKSGHHFGKVCIRIGGRAGG